MAIPTTNQILAPVAKPKYKVEIEFSEGVYTVIDNDYIKMVDGAVEVSSSNNGLAFGTQTLPRLTIEMTSEYADQTWELRRGKVSYGFDTSDYVATFEGVITNRSRDGRYLTFTLDGWKALIERNKIYTTIYYRRPIATKTTLNSIENPNTVGYAAGILNRIMWDAGGRPYEQYLTYFDSADRKFWYSFDQSLLRPRWSWVGGENAWDVAVTLVKATGGQLYQGGDGIMYYRQPLSFGSISGTPYAIDSSMFVSISEEITARDKIATIKCAYTERNIQANQTVFELEDSFFIRPSQTIIKEFDPQYPVYRYLTDDTGNIPFNALVAVYFDGRSVVSATELTLTTTVLAATKIQVSFTNNTTSPISVEKIIIQGRPITEGSSGITSYGSGFPELELEDSIFIDSEQHAYRLCRLVYDFYNTARSVYTLNGMGYDPRRYVGEIVSFTYADWSLSGNFRIVAIRHSNTGARMDIDIVPIANLPTRELFFIIDQVYADSDTRMVSY